MNETIVLNKNPRIEFHFLEKGFKLIDDRVVNNKGFYPYDELHFIALNNLWFPRLAKWLRAISWIFNGVPYFPDAESYKKANLIIHLRNVRIGIWLTNSYMATQAKMIKTILYNKTALEDEF